jgi:hypothetical protein
MKKIVFSLAMLASFFLFNTGETRACDCIIFTGDLKPLVETAYKYSSAVFSGKVIEVKRDSHLRYISVRFRIEKSWKNNFLNEVIIKTASDDGDCGYDFIKGVKYLVYAEVKENTIEANLCTRTAPLKNNKDLAILNKIKMPKSFPK